MIHGISRNDGLLKIVFGFTICLFSSAIFIACGKPKEIEYSESTGLFGASLSEASELLGIDIESGKYSEEVLGGQNYKVYTTDDLYTFNGYETSIALYFSQNQAPDGQEIGLTIVLFSFEELIV